MTEANSVPTTDVVFQVPTEFKALSDGTNKFIAACAAALKDGFQPGSDVPAIIVAAMNDLFPAIKRAQEFKEDIKQRPVECSAYAAQAILGTIKAL